MKKIYKGFIALSLVLLAFGFNLNNSEAEPAEYYWYTISGEETVVAICDGSGTSCQSQGTIIIQKKKEEIAP